MSEPSISVGLNHLHIDKYLQSATIAVLQSWTSKGVKATLPGMKVFLLALAALFILGMKTGDIAPEFAARNQDGKLIHLSDFKGRPVLLYFYPKDDTPGCTKEAQGFRDKYAKFKELGVVILGVSGQGEKSHQEFRAKYQLPFDLLVDDDGALAKAYDTGTMLVIGLHKRKSVLIGRDGKVLHFYGDVDPSTHTAEVLKDLGAADSK